MSLAVAGARPRSCMAIIWKTSRLAAATSRKRGERTNKTARSNARWGSPWSVTIGVPAASTTMGSAPDSGLSTTCQGASCQLSWAAVGSFMLGTLSGWEWWTGLDVHEVLTEHRALARRVEPDGPAQRMRSRAAVLQRRGPAAHHAHKPVDCGSRCIRGMRWRAGCPRGRRTWANTGNGFGRMFQRLP